MADGQRPRGVDHLGNRVDVGERVHDTGHVCSVGTNAEDANTSGKTQMNPTDWAVSGLRTDTPTNALIQENT